MGRLNHTALAAIFTLMLLSGCSTTKIYRNELPQNLEVSSRIESVQATLDIYSVSKQCETEYLGTVALDRNMLELGIATEKPSYLVVGFAGSSFWGSSSSYISYDIILFPRKPYQYGIDVSYIDDIYQVTVYEINKNSGEKRKMEEKELAGCRQFS